MVSLRKSDRHELLKHINGNPQASPTPQQTTHSESRKSSALPELDVDAEPLASSDSESGLEALDISGKDPLPKGDTPSRSFIQPRSPPLTQTVPDREEPVNGRNGRVEKSPSVDASIRVEGKRWRDESPDGFSEFTQPKRLHKRPKVVYTTNIHSPRDGYGKRSGARGSRDLLVGSANSPNKNTSSEPLTSDQPLPTPPDSTQQSTSTPQSKRGRQMFKPPRQAPPSPATARRRKPPASAKFKPPAKPLESPQKPQPRPSSARFQKPPRPSADQSNERANLRRSSRRQQKAEFRNPLEGLPLSSQGSALSDEKDEDALENAESSGHSSPLTTLSSSRLSSPDFSSLNSNYVLPSFCPVCNGAVDTALLEEHLRGRPRMAFREQQKFCRAHQRGAARDEYRVLGYPTIDWHTLDMRMAQHESYLHDILYGVSESHFRKELAKWIAGGKNRNLIQSLSHQESLERMTPGYYGAKGQRVMMDFIKDRFSRQLEDCHASDRLIARAGGVSGFIQTVMVPELATRLIAEDMNVNEARAIEILAESAGLGELVNEAEEDVVKKRSASIEGHDFIEDYG